MSRGQRILRGMMWGSGAMIAVAAIVCIVTANFFFPGGDHAGQLADLGNQPKTTTYFHADDATSIRLWKISFAVGGLFVAVLMFAALLYGFFYPPAEQTDAS